MKTILVVLLVIVIFSSGCVNQSVSDTTTLAYLHKEDFTLTMENNVMEIDYSDYRIKVTYVSNNPQELLFRVNDEEKRVIIGENQGCVSQFQENCEIDENGSKNCELVETGKRCRIGGICVGERVSFGIDSEGEDWNTDRLHILLVVTIAPCNNNQDIIPL